MRLPIGAKKINEVKQQCMQDGHITRAHNIREKKQYRFRKQQLDDRESLSYLCTSPGQDHTVAGHDTGPHEQIGHFDRLH